MVWFFATEIVKVVTNFVRADGPGMFDNPFTAGASPEEVQRKIKAAQKKVQTEQFESNNQAETRQRAIRQRYDDDGFDGVGYNPQMGDLQETDKDNIIEILLNRVGALEARMAKMEGK